MPDFITFDFTKKSPIEESFRVQKIRSAFDYQNKTSEEHFKGEIKMPEKWQIGAIVGASGTGKTSIASKLFPEEIKQEYEYSHKSVIDDMPTNRTVDEITRMFYAVGFGSVPSWLKPFSVLSNGEKMRVELANRLLRNELSIFDEFTSVVDRNVAKTMCIATNKTMKKMPDKKLVVVSCHYDILEWLQPDWVFDTNEFRGFFGRSHDLNQDMRFGEWQEKSGKCFASITI